MNKRYLLVTAADCSVHLRANSQGTGFVVTDEDGHTILEFSAPVGGGCRYFLYPTESGGTLQWTCSAHDSTDCQGTTGRAAF